MIPPRKMRKQDVDAVSALYRREEDACGNNLPSGIKEASGYVIETGGECVGFISVTTLKDEPYIDYLLVAADHRGKGYATSLVRELQKSHDHLFLHVLHENKGAIRLYMRCKFKTVSYGAGVHQDKLRMEWSR